MNILQINTAADTGGAGVAMSRLHRALTDQGHRSQIVARLRRTPQPDVLTISEAVGAGNSAVHRFLNNVRMQLDAWFVLPRLYGSTERLLQSALFEQADAIQLHNLHSWYLNYELLPQIAARKPIVWTLHDMWAFTGHCAYSYDCNRWRTGCFDCPLLRGDGRRLVEPRPTLLDRTAQQWQKKRALYRNSQLHIVAPSEWMADQARASVMGDALSIRCIPNGIDLALFSPRDQADARQSLGIRREAKVILFVAAKVSQRRKGLDYLYEALHSLRGTRDIVLVTVGSVGANQPQLEGFAQVHLGQVVDESRLSLAYSAADLYVLPTLADNQPLTVLESLASGTPVVAFDVGGIPEMNAHLDTGYLAHYKDASDLAAGMRTLLDDDALRARMRERCRETAVARYDLREQARRYVELYEQAVRTHQQHANGGKR